jgi:hypothetical protein
VGQSTRATRDDVIKAVGAVQLAERSYHQARAGQEHARSTASATAHVKFKAEHEAAADQIISCAVDAEAILAAYRAQTDSDYHSGMQEATVRSRALHEKRLELQQQMTDLAQEIARVTEQEAPDVQKAVLTEQARVEFANNQARVVGDCVRLTQAVAAA